MQSVKRNVDFRVKSIIIVIIVVVLVVVVVVVIVVVVSRLRLTGTFALDRCSYLHNVMPIISLKLYLTVTRVIFSVCTLL